jgi:hypothetical protein
MENFILFKAVLWSKGLPRLQLKSITWLNQTKTSQFSISPFWTFFNIPFINANKVFIYLWLIQSSWNMIWISDTPKYTFFLKLYDFREVYINFNCLDQNTDKSRLNDLISVSSGTFQYNLTLWFWCRWMLIVDNIPQSILS